MLLSRYSAGTMTGSEISLRTGSNEISVGFMPQQALVRRPEDDWTGTIDRERRRHRQNRLNQRAYRARRQAKNNNHALIGTGSKEDQGLLVNHPPIDTPLVVPQQYRFSCQLAPPDAHEQMIELESQAARSYMLGSPNTDHLLTLSRLNIQHAINHNIVSIGMTREWLKCDESISIFNVLTPGFSEERIPTSLHPTALQRTKPHHPWLDAFPFPQMRDNLIAVEDEMDDDGLCRDLMAFWDTRNAGAMLLVWGDAWDPRNWEVTEEFLGKWGWVVQGCKEIVESTNAWRRLRGERKVVWNG